MFSKIAANACKMTGLLAEWFQVLVALDIKHFYIAENYQILLFRWVTLTITLK